MGSDLGRGRICASRCDFNPRSPHGERPVFMPVCACICLIISIHAPRMGSDCRSPTGPWRWRGISIHAPRMGSDRLAQHHRRGLVISIHAPRMGSDISSDLARLIPDIFQSTLPGWGATPAFVTMRRTLTFQSTLPAWGATCIHASMCMYLSDYFNPRSPDGERPRCSGTWGVRWYFNPRSPDGERPRLVCPS